MTFDPQCKRAYVICETSSTIIGFNYNPTNGTLSAFQTVSTLPAGFSGANTTAEIAVHPSGKFVYGSNRGYNSIVVFTVNPTDGTLTQVQQQATGTTPRNFAIDPTGAFCIVANQDSNNVLLYSIHPQTGLLTATGQSLAVSKPVCILPLIIDPPVITQQPSNQNVAAGATASFTVTASGASPLNYQWQKNNTDPHQRRALLGRHDDHPDDHQCGYERRGKLPLCGDQCRTAAPTQSTRRCRSQLFHPPRQPRSLPPAG